MNKKTIAKIVSLVFVIVAFIVGYKVVDKYVLKSDYIKQEAKQNNGKSIVVLGSEPEAITAAATAARLGYKVDLITQGDKLGGLFTAGMLTALDLNYIKSNEILHEGFFTEFYDNASNGHNLDLEKTQKFFDEVVKHDNINLVKLVDDIIPLVDKDNPKKAIGVSYKKDGKVVDVKADFILDGSYEAEFSRKMGVEYRTGRSEFGQPDTYAAAGIMFSIKGVDWQEMKKAIEKENNPETGVKGNAAWGFAQMYDYVPQNDIFKMRGLNISRQDDGSIVLNALLVLGVDPLNEESYKYTIELSKEEIPYIVDYMKENLPGFENASLDKIAEDLYIREGVRVVGDETLDGYDIIAHTQYKDVIGYGSYPSDLQTARKDGYGNAQNGRSVYEVPLSAMLPKSIDNVIVLGRCASLDIVAHGSARTVPVLMSMSQGAVHAVDYALTNDMDIREVRDNYMPEVHKEMKKIGKMSMPKMEDNPYEGHFAEEYIKHLRIRGVLSSKYFEVMPLDEPASMKEVRAVVNLLLDHSNIEFTSQQIESLKHIKEPITNKELIDIISILVGIRFETLGEFKSYGVISEGLYNNLKDAERLNNSHMYGVLSDYIKFKQQNFKEDIKTDKIDTRTM